VSGGTGAALLVSRHFVEKVSFKNADGGLEFFDERFFAYREDAELALRAARYGLKYLYVPQSVFYHVRKVLPENRSELPTFLNALSVRNRLLLLFSHYSFRFPLSVQLATFLRNILVFTYALMLEKDSRQLLFKALGSSRSHFVRRKEINSKTIVANYSEVFE
jgi:GT2 family glycosyltransferase